MRKINLLIIHCAASKPGQEAGVAVITKWHKLRGFLTIGYHFVIRRDGTLETGRPITDAGAHATNYNANSIGVCLEGGLDASGKASCNYTAAQWQTLNKFAEDTQHTYKDIKIIGHNEVAKKECPCFNVQNWLKAGRGVAKENIV